VRADEVFRASDAAQLVALAKAVHLGMSSFREMTRDAGTGRQADCANVLRTAHQFSEIFAGHAG